VADQLSFAVDCVREAGRRILRYFQTDLDVRHKSPNNPVTAADLDADAFLRQAFARQYPSDGWLSEETADSPHRLSRSRVWVVDPIDGTKEFVAGIPEFAISLALVKNHRPVVAVVFNPAADDIVTAAAGEGTRRNGVAVRMTDTRELLGARFLVSHTEHARGSFSQADSLPSITPVGSIAWKLALAASGAADAVVSVRPKNEWDVCAGVLLIEEAGGVASDVLGREFEFNQPRLPVNGVVASNKPLRWPVLDWVSRLPACRPSNP